MRSFTRMVRSVVLVRILLDVDDGDIGRKCRTSIGTRPTSL